MEEACPYCGERTSSPATEEEIKKIPRFRLMDVGPRDQIRHCHNPNCNGMFAQTEHRNVPIEDDRMPTGLVVAY
jgi:hypothetical protein